MPVTKKFTQGVTQITAANLNKTGFYNLVAREQDAPNMTLAISSGIAIINGVTVKYTGGNTGVFTAPSVNPRIDLVTLSSSGTIVLIAGTEAASPLVPDYPVGSFVICEVYLRTGSTKIYQEDQGTNSYIYTESRFLGVENNRFKRFFGTGADGAVTIASGTTTLASDMNYSYLTIAAGAYLKTNGYKVFVLNELINNGTIYSNGGNGGNAARATIVPDVYSQPGTAGTATSAGTLSAGTSGKIGGAPPNANPRPGAGGGSGASGGIILICARKLTNNSTIQANGGNGGNGAEGRAAGTSANVTGNAGVAGDAKTALGSNGVAGGAGGGNGAGAGGAGGGAGTCTSETVAVNATLASSGNLTAGSSNTYNDFITYSVTASTNTTSLSCSAGSGSGGSGSASTSNTSSGGGGGGGGGSGGVIILLYNSITLGTVQCLGGTKGTKGTGVSADYDTYLATANGVDGTDGLSGKIYKLIIS